LGLNAFADEEKSFRKIVVCRETTLRTMENGIEVFPWRDFLYMLWTKGL
jgi:hypothetical protein